jgi:hypothetical protein
MNFKGGKMLYARNLTGYFNIMLMGHVFGLQKHRIGNPDLQQLQGCWTDWGETCRA